jgi:hypothetical protein
MILNKTCHIVIRFLAAIVVVTIAISTQQQDLSAIENPQILERLLKHARNLAKRLDEQYARWSNKQSIAGWNYASNLTDKNLVDKLNVSAAAARISKEIALQVNAFPWRNLKDDYLKRQFSKLGVLGIAALPEDVRI